MSECKMSYQRGASHDVGPGRSPYHASSISSRHPTNDDQNIRCHDGHQGQYRQLNHAPSSHPAVSNRTRFPLPSTSGRNFRAREDALLEANDHFTYHYFDWERWEIRYAIAVEVWEVFDRYHEQEYKSYPNLDDFFFDGNPLPAWQDRYLPRSDEERNGAVVIRTHFTASPSWLEWRRNHVRAPVRPRAEPSPTVQLPTQIQRLLHSNTTSFSTGGNSQLKPSVFPPAMSSMTFCPKEGISLRQTSTSVRSFGDNQDRQFPGWERRFDYPGAFYVSYNASTSPWQEPPNYVPPTSTTEPESENVMEWASRVGREAGFETAPTN